MRGVLLLLVLAWCSQVAAQANFQDVSTGVPMFSTLNARSVAIADYDNDGDDDILIASEPTKLYRNDGNFLFTEVGQASGINFTATIAVMFDADDDGWLDVLLATSWEVKFYKSDRDGSFTASTTSGFYPASNQAFLVGDLNGDQLLDVYTNNLSKWNQLFVNTGSAKFVDVVSGSGASWSSFAMGGTLVDIDRDNDLDIYIVFDGRNPDQLFLNDGSGHFTNASVQYKLDVKSEAMGVDFADFNHDGKYDFYITNLWENMLMLQQPDSTFVDNAESAGVDDNGMGWGVVCFDYNNDTYADVYVVNSYLYNLYSNRLYKNNGNNTFTDVADGTALEVNKNGYGTATGDFNSDGKPDIVVANYGSDGVRVLKNNEAGVGNWIEINLVGTTSNKFGVGSRVEVQLGSLTLLEEVTAGSGYKSQNSFRVHVGVGNAASVEEIRIKWPDGSVNAYQNVSVNTRYLAIQNESLTVFDAGSYFQALTRPSLLLAPPDTFETGPGLEGNSIARLWNEALLNSIRNDFARPTVHARNLFHFSMAMYDAWAAFDVNNVSTYFLGQTHGDFYCPFTGIVPPENRTRAREEAISYAAFRLLSHRFANSPGAGQSLASAKKLLDNLGYDQTFTSTDYSSGSPAALGNYIASKIIEFGLQDGSNEANGYANQFYQPVNVPMKPEVPGNLNCVDPNRWQQIQLVVSIDQNGQPVSSTPPFLGPEWGKVFPFALKESDLNKYPRDGHEWWVYHDPGQPPLLDTVTIGGLSEEFKWNFELVSIWASHLDPSDSVKIDISPASKGNIALEDYPTTVQAYHDFYKLEEGGDIGQGYALNPVTNQPYSPQVVPRGDYARVLAEFWADGPKSETPPGHWFTILNYVTDHPAFERKFQGEGEELDPLEWDVKSYLVLGGALHDVAISAWGIKGYYDYTRPVFAIRYMADHGQSSDPDLPSYHPAGLQLKEGFIELVEAGDPLAGVSNEHVGKIKLYTWRGPNYISDPKTEIAGVGWILAENWWPYQRPTFVTPPFAGYISGHSTYSSAAAEVLTQLTGDEYFPGGMGEFVAKKNQYLVFEEGPSRDIKLQWARYKDASDQSSLSRIWGGIHPPIDDIPGRFIGKQIGADAFAHAERYFNGLVSATEDGRATMTTAVYPNPVLSDEVYIRIAQEVEDLSVEFFDMTGKLMFKNQFPETASQFTVTTAYIPNGMYIVRLKGRNYFTHQKILIRRF